MDTASAAQVWDRSALTAFGAPPKADLKTASERAASAAPPARPSSARTMRRNPSALQARMLRKTRNFALAKFDEVPAHLEQTVVSEWTELVTKPPREDAEIRAAWVADALRAGWNMAGTSQLRGLEAQDAHVADLERAAYPTAVPRAAGEGLVERLVVTYREQLQGDEQPWPEQLVLKMPSFGSFDSYDSLGEQQRYHLAELTFLTESVNSTAHNIVLPNVHWFFLRPPGEKQLRTHWKWAKGTPVFDGQYPYELGEYCCLLEDLYDSSPLVDGAMEREHAEAVVKALASLHAAFWANEETLENPCFKSTQTVKMSDVKDVVAGLLKRSQLPEHVAALLPVAAERRNELLAQVRSHGLTLTRGCAGCSVGSWLATPKGLSSMSWGDTCVGVGVRDLALLLTLGLGKEQQDDWTHELRALYYDTLTGASNADGGGESGEGGGEGGGGAVVDPTVYTHDMFEGDYQVMLWDVAFDQLISAGRELLATPALSSDLPYRERKRIMEQLAVPQGTIAAVCRALQLGDAHKAIGEEQSSDEDED
jgi:hypothetical protein